MEITFLLPATTICGGIRSTFEIASRLQLRGHDVSVIYSLMPNRHLRSLPTRIRAKHYLRNNFKSPKEIKDLDWFDLKSKLIEVPFFKDKFIPKADIIVATWWENAFDVYNLKQNKGKKFHFIRSYETWGGPEELVDKCYTLDLVKMTISEKLKSFIEKKFNVKVHGPLQNGINFNLFYKEKEGFDRHSPRRIGMVYRDQELKGMKDGFEAFSIARQKHPDIQLVLFGELLNDEDKKNVESIGGVEYHHMPYKDKLRKIYNSLTIFLCSSHYEGFHNPPMESMACGAACVTTNIGGVKDYAINGKTALISEIKNPQGLANNIIKLLDDEEHRQQMAEQGHNCIQRFTWDKTILELEKIFKMYI